MRDFLQTFHSEKRTVPTEASPPCLRTFGQPIFMKMLIILDRSSGAICTHYVFGPRLAPGPKSAGDKGVCLSKWPSDIRARYPPSLRAINHCYRRNVFCFRAVCLGGFPGFLGFLEIMFCRGGGAKRRPTDTRKFEGDSWNNALSRIDPLAGRAQGGTIAYYYSI